MAMLTPARAVARRTAARLCLLQQSSRFSSKTNFASGQAAEKQSISPSRPSPRHEIPPGAAQLVCEPPGPRSSAGGGRGSVTISWTPDLLLIQDSSSSETTSSRHVLRPATLRDNCACSACRDASSGQKSFSSVEIAPDVGISHVRATHAGLAITFSNEIARFARQKHETVVPWSEALSGGRPASLPTRRSILRRTGVRYWDGVTLARHVRKIDYGDFMTSGPGHGHGHDLRSRAFWDVIIDLCRLGIVFLTNVPRDEGSIVNVTTRIANIRETLYGRTFDVRAKLNAENVAYTSGHLGLHQDLCYLSPPPMIQVLHCMDNSCRGGESLFSDGERAGRLLWPFVQSSSKLAPLALVPVPYQYDKHGHNYHAARTVIDHDETGFAGVFWSPPFQGRHQDPAMDLKHWIEPARLFDQLINDPRAVYTCKMAPGECVLFDNLRVMHGRNAFDATAGGERWLRGAYLAAEDFLSRAAHMPAGHAEMYRGPEAWTPDAAQKELRDGQWHADVLDRVRALDPDLDHLELDLDQASPIEAGYQA